MKKMIAVVSGLLLSPFSMAKMTLQQEASTLSFVSIKQESVAEIHTFKALSGFLKEGVAEISVSLSSVNTGIDIRDQRMRDFLFETRQFPEARYTANFDEERLNDLQSGHSFNETLTGQLSLHSEQVPVNADVKVMRLNDGSISIITTRPILINAADFGLVQRINKLRELAGLKSISYAVPVTFSVAFK